MLDLAIQRAIERRDLTEQQAADADEAREASLKAAAWERYYMAAQSPSRDDFEQLWENGLREDCRRVDAGQRLAKERLQINFGSGF
jgi:hypothetical protein